MIVTMMKETRATVILTRLAKKIRKETGNPIYRARTEDERASLRTLIYISCTRPICKLTVLFICGFGGISSSFSDLLCTEPLVLSFSVRTALFLIFNV
jgi:hypothetical protein